MEQNQEQGRDQDQDRDPQPLSNSGTYNGPLNTIEEYQREQDRLDEAKHEGATIYAEKVCDMMGIEDEEERVKMVEGFRAMMSGGPKFPGPGQMMIPVKLEPMPDSCCVITKDDGGGSTTRITVVDWMCILSRCYQQIFRMEDDKDDNVVLVCDLHIYGRQLPVKLNVEQTTHMLRWLKAMDEWQTGNPYGGTVRLPRQLLSHPAVQSVLNQH